MAKAIKTALVAAAVTALTIATFGKLGLAVPAIFTAKAGAGALATAIAGSLPLQYAIMTAAGTLISAGIGMLTSRGIEATAQNFGTKLTGRSAQAPRQIVYGKCRVAGTIVKMTTSGTLNNKLHLAAVIAGHEIQSLEKVYINDVELTTTSAVDGSGETVFTVTNTDFTNTDNDNSFGSGRLIRFTFHDGSQTAVDGLAAAALPSDYPSTAKFQGMAYVYMELIYDPEKNAQLPALWFEVKGKKVYDPRSASTAWSDNPALIIRDYLTDTLYGLKATSSEINDGSSAAVGNFYKAADICDETVSIPDANLTTYAVTVSGGKFYIDGVQQPTLNLKEGNTYKFDQSDSTNSSHPLRFSTTSDGTHGGGSQYTTGVTTNGTAGSSGAYTQITVATGAPTLYYYCTNHSGMGGTANTPSGSTETRYTANGFTNASASGEGILEGLLTSCAGSITYTNGKFNLFVGGDQTASLTITDEDVIGDISISTKSGSGELYNTVKSIFVDADSKYETMEAPVYENATYLAADTPSGEASANYKKIMELQFPFTVSQTMAQRLGAISLDRQRQTSTISLLTTLEYMKLQPNDWVNVTNSRMSYSSKTFEVISTNLEFAENDGQIFAATRLTLQEIDTTIYDYDAGNYIDYVAEGVDASGGSLSISAPTGLTLTQINGQEGTNAKISVQVAWTNNGNDAIQGTEIQYRLSTDGATDYKTAGFAGKGETKITFAGAIVGTQYYVRIRHIAFDNVLSPYTSTANITIAEPDTISAPTSVSASTGKVGFIEIGFTAPAVESVSKVDIHYSTSSGFTPASGNLLTSVAVSNAQVLKHAVGQLNGLAYGTTYYFKLIAKNVYGTASSASSEVSGSFAQAGTADISDAAISVAKFASSLEPVTLVTSVPSALSTQAVFNTTTNELLRWNGSAYVSAQGATSFSELSGTLAAGQAAVNSIQEAAIQAGAITVTKIGDAAVETAKLDAGAVTTAKLDALAVTASKIATGTITANEIATDTITANEIAGSTITANEIAGNTITAGQIQAGAIGADEIAADSLSVAKLISNTSKTFGGTGGTDFKFEFGTNTQVAGFQGAGILRAGVSSGFGVAGLANASNTIAIAGQNAHNSTDAYGAYFANSTVLGGTTHRSQAGLANNARGGVFADSASPQNLTYLANGTYAVQTTGDVYVDGDITATGTISPFTGMHDGLMADTDTPSVGDILVDSSVAAKKDISNTLFLMASSSSTNQSAIGIYAGDRGSDYIPAAIADHAEVTSIHESGAPTLSSDNASLLTDRKVVVVNSLGEGQVNVCGEGGDIASGDLIATSSTAGKGMKQSDDIVRGYTVAKARESITFANASDTGQIACIYLCG